MVSDAVGVKECDVGGTNLARGHSKTQVADAGVNFACPTRAINACGLILPETGRKE